MFFLFFPKERLSENKRKSFVKINYSFFFIHFLKRLQVELWSILILKCWFPVGEMEYNVPSILEEMVAALLSIP